MAQISYLEDFAKELEVEFGLGREEALEICRLSIDHAYELMKDPEVVTIRFPMLGNMCFNMKKGKYSKIYTYFKSIVGRQVEITERMVSENKDIAHGRNMYFSIIRKYFYPDPKVRAVTRRKEVFRKIENNQNK